MHNIRTGSFKGFIKNQDHPTAFTDEVMRPGDVSVLMAGFVGLSVSETFTHANALTNCNAVGLASGGQRTKKRAGHSLVLLRGHFKEVSRMRWVII